jgi:translocation and assembly module TamB
MRRALRIAAWVVGCAAAFLILAVAAVVIGGNTEAGRSAIEKLTLRLTSGHVVIAGLGGSFPRHLTVAHLELSDYRGVWLSADKVSVDWSPLALLARRIQVDALHAAGADIERLPESRPNAPSGPVSIPRIDAAAVNIDVVRVAAPLAGRPASLVLRGNAHLRSVTDMLIDASAHRIDGDGDYVLRLRFDTTRMDAALTLHEPAGGPLENLLQLPGLGALAVTASLNGPRTAERLEVSVDAGPLRGRAQGRLDLNVLSGDLDFAVDSPAMAPRADFAWERASIHGRWHGSVKTPQADAHIEVQKLRLPGSAQADTVHGDLTADSGAAGLHAVIGGLRIAGLQPQLLADSPLNVDASMRLDREKWPLDLSASHRLFSLHAVTEVAADDQGKRSATVEVKLPDLTPVAALAGQRAGGNAVIKGEVSVDQSAIRVNLGAGAVLRPEPTFWSGVVGDKVALQVSGVVAGGSVTVDSMKVSGRAVTLTASGGVQGGSTLRARWELDLPDLTTLSPTLTGSLKANGTLAGPFGSLAGNAQLTTTLAVRDSASGTVSAAVNVQGLPSAPSGNLKAQGVLDGAPLLVDVALERARAGMLRALIHRVDWKSTHAEGDVTIAPAAAQAHSELRVQIGQLEDLRDFLGMNVGGSLAGDVVLHSEQGRTRAKLHLDARDLKAGQLAGNAQLDADGVADAMGVKLDVEIPDLGGAKAGMSARGSVDLEARKITLATVVANYRGQDVRLLSPAQISLANGVAIDALKIGAQNAIFQLKGEITPALDVRASLSKVEPSLVNAFVPGLLTSGEIEAHAKLQGTLAAPTGEVRLTAKDVRLGDDAALGLPPLELDASAQLAGDAAEIDARSSVGGASRLNVTGRVPLTADGMFAMKVGGKFDLAMISPLLEAHGLQAAGNIEVDATVAGNRLKPRIEGEVTLTKGSVHDYGRGIGLTDITATVVGSEGNLEIKSFTASAAPGTVSMTGTLGVLQSHLPLDLHIKADNAQPLASKLLTAILDADLRVSGSARERLDIAGEVHLHRTLIGIPNGLPPNVAVLDVRRRGKIAPAPSAKQLVIGLDLKVEAPEEIKVSGRGLDAVMGGNLQIRGTTDDPIVTGGFKLQRGNFSLAGNRLTFTSGSVSFNGAGLKNKIDPSLDFTAETVMSDATATLRITGLADAPQFEFTSSPALPQDEILARLLFGVPGTQLSGLQLAQIGAALAAMSGVGGDGLNPLVKIQKTLGLDRLAVGAGSTNPTTGESTGASIEAGRYLSRRVYVEARQTTTGTAQLQADIELTKSLKLRTRLGNGTASVTGTTPENDPGSSVGLIYQFEY